MIERLGLLGVLVALSAAWADGPNVVIIFTDDQGWADVGVYGAEGFETPHIDRLASEGVRFTDFYVAQPVCSASRAALLTGCYPNRIGIRGALGPRSKFGLNADETTLAEVCKSKGYATAIYGKWHLGVQDQFLPTRHGFDEFYGIPYSNDMWPWHPSVAHIEDPARKRKEGYPDLPLFENETVAINEVLPSHQEQFTRAFTERAVEFIDRHADERFFVYLAHPMPHVPLFTDASFVGVSDQGRYGDVISEIDWSVGQVMEALERHGLTDDTLVIFASDNGPWLSYGNHAGSTGPLREGKGTTFEGGVRVPCVMRWPGHIPAGRVCDEPVMTIDVLPTVARLIGAELPEKTIDGVDIWGHIVNDATGPAHEALFFYYHNNHLEAMRSGSWKLHFPHGYRSLSGRTPGMDGSTSGYDYSVKTGVELYDLSVDIGESVDVSEAHPDVVARMTEMADRMRQELGDKLTEQEGSARRPAGTLP